MTKRSVVTVILLAMVTCGIYQLIWMVKTKDEMNARGAQVPTAWFLIVPILNIIWLWKFGEAVGQVTNNKISGPLAFIMMWFIGPIGAGIIQGALNEVEGGAAMARPA